ncbi:SH2 domain-containing protein 5, partial [Taenia solium]
TIYMAHALRRISYATCDPHSSKFAFLAREANSETPCQYCHIFATETQYQAEELNAIIGDAFKLAYAKQRMPQQHQGSTDIQLPALSSLHPVELLLPLPPKQTVEESTTPPLQIPPPPPTSPPPPPRFSANSPSPIFHERGVGEKQGQEAHCNGNPRHVSSYLRRHWLQEEAGGGVGGSERGVNKAAMAGVSGQSSVTARQRAFSDPRAPCPHLLQHQQHNQHQQKNPLRRHPPPARHSVAFFDAPSPVSPKFSVLQSPPPQTPSPPLPISPISVKDKYRAIFDLPLGAFPDLSSLAVINLLPDPIFGAMCDNSLSTIAASPVVALKTHLDSLANESKKPLTKQAAHHKKSESSFPSSGNGVVSRFRLRQSGGSGGGGGKKRQLERPLSQIICQLDSALLLNNSPSFSVQPRSEERLSAVAPSSNTHSTVTEEENDPESDDVVGVPGDIVQCLDDMENPPVPPLRSCGGAFRHSSSEASPHGSRGRGVPLQSLSESSGAEILELETENLKDGGSTNEKEGAEEKEEEEGEEEEEEEEDAEDVEFAILEAAAAAEAEAEELGAVAATSQRDRKLADVCPVPPLAGPAVAWQSKTVEATSVGEMLGPCPLHAGLEPSPSLPHIENSSNQQLKPLAVINGGCMGGLNAPRPTPTPSRQQPHHQPGRWTGETPTPTATPTPTPTPVPLLMSRHPAPPWFQAYLPREVALELLMHEETGSFLVRDSVTQPGCWALSVRVPTHVNCVGITHYLIQHSKHGVKLKGLDKEWPSLEALITHLTVMPEMLPCPLRLPPAVHSAGVGGNHHHQASNPTFTEEEDEEGEGATGTVGVVEKGDEEYQRLSDFSSMLADMQPATAVPHLFRDALQTAGILGASSGNCYALTIKRA